VFGVLAGGLRVGGWLASISLFSLPRLLTAGFDADADVEGGFDGTSSSFHPIVPYLDISCFVFRVSTRFDSSRLV
jgi:hypothetical protein